MLHDPREKALFPELPAEVVEELPKYGEVLELSDGAVLFREGDRDYPFYAVLDGRVRITKRIGAELQTLAIHHRGEFAGEISMLPGGPAIATGTALGPARVVRIGNAEFRHFAGSDAPLARVVLSAMAARSKDVEAQSRQQDKLVALGRLSAGLAHELNNPAAAAKRAAQMLRDALEDLRVQSIRYDCRFSAEQRELLQRIEAELRSPENVSALLDAVERSDREEELAAWLAAHDLPDAWELAPTLTEAGFTTACLDSMAAGLHGPALAGAIGWLEKSLRAANLAAELHSATSRISELVAAMKEYTYMDRGDLQDTDVHRGLESTLVMFTPRLKKSAVKVERRYATDLPVLCAHPGELNQVWTNLIDNALDAMDDRGTLTIATRREVDGIAVEIGDTGPGIPPEIRARIFEPFFTTKAVGKGTGLGLDIVYRIVRARHGGSVQVTSVPGDTRFEVRLPLKPPKEG